MPGKFSQFKTVRQRMRRTLNYGKEDRINQLNEPLTKMVVDYFDRNSAFDSLEVDFVANISAENHVDPCTLVVAMIYIERLKEGTHFHDFKPSELYLSALILATKLFNDAGNKEFYWNDEWASASGFTISKVNQLELQLLQNLEWNILVIEKGFEEAFESMEKWIALDSIQRNGFTTYNELNVISTNNLKEYMKKLEQFLQQFAIFTAIYLSSLMAFVILPCAVLPILQTNVSVVETDLNSPIFANSTEILLEQISYQVISPKTTQKKSNSVEWNYFPISYKEFGLNWENEMKF